MKHKIDKKYLGWGITSFLVILLSIVCVYIVFHLNNVSYAVRTLFKVCTPIIDGLILAYLFTPILNYLEAKLIRPAFDKSGLIRIKNPDKKIRMISILLTTTIVIAVLFGFFSIVIPQIILSIQSIIFQFPVYMYNLEKWVNVLLEKNPDIEIVVNQFLMKFSEEITNYLQTEILPHVNELIKTLSLSLIGIVKALFNFIVGFIVSIYLLGSKETLCGQAKKIAFAIFETDKANKVIKAFRHAHKTFIGFIVGKIIDSIIIGILCFILTSIVGTPYGVLISCIIGVTNVIPFFGPYIGAIPSALLVLMVNPLQCLYFVLLILLLQQFDGNILGPKILGESTGLSSFWVIFAITFAGGLFGIPGMILGVPVFAVLYAGVRSLTTYLLRQKDLPTETEPYLSVESIGKEHEFITYVPKYMLKKKKGIRDKQILDDTQSYETIESEDESDKNCKER